MMSFAVVVILKATFVCGAAFLLARLCRRARASIRHLLFALAFAALIAIPAAGSLVPAVTVMLPAAAVFPEGAGAKADLAVQSGVNPGPARHIAPAIAEPSEAEWRPAVPQALAVLWLIGVAVFLLPVLAGFWQAHRLRRTAVAWAGGQDLLQSLASTRGVHRRIDVVLHDDVAGPLTCGVLRPSIILPLTSRDWDETSLRRALRHELDHVARWDLLTNCLSRLICAAYWFHPMVWAAWRRLRLEAEKACDDAVVLEDDASEYALLLVSLAQPAAAGQPPLLEMASRDDLTARVAALLDHDQTRGPVGRRMAAALIVVAAAAMIGVAPITVARAMPQAQAANAAAQAPTAAAGSIRRNQPTGIRNVDGRTIATGMSVRALLIAAFAVRDIENVPFWVRADRFDIVFDATYRFGPQQESTAMQAFLTERFKLVAHRASKEFPVYALVQAQPNRTGAGLTPSQLDCSNRTNCGLSSSDGRLTGRGVTMAELVRVLPAHLGSVPGGRQIFDRQLMDRTGLSGQFDFQMAWEKDTDAPFVSGPELNAPRFLAALQQQLGLTIESQTAPAPVLVIDSIEPPVEK